MNDPRREQLTSPHVRRSSQNTPSTMEIMTGTGGEEGWGPPTIGQAWSEPPVGKAVLQRKTESWVENNPVPKLEKVQKEHPVSAETRKFLDGMVSNLRNTVQSNTGVMSLLEAPVSVFEEGEPPPVALNVEAHLKIDRELEKFLAEIREIRDGPTKPAAGSLGQEIATHLETHEEAVKEAITSIETELPDQAEEEEEGEPTPQSDGTCEPVDPDIASTGEEVVSSRDDTASLADASTIVGDDLSSLHDDISSRPATSVSEAGEEKTEPEEPEKPAFKKMGMYELLAIHPDKKVRRAALKMKQLDNQLKMAVRREKEVKKQREVMNRQLLLYAAGKELFETSPERSEQATESVVEDDGELTSVSELPPIFATQINDDERGSTVGSTTSRSKGSSTTATSKMGSTAGRKINSVRRTREDKRSVNNKNFIARNKELAQDASSAVAMTEEEKQRLNELLMDLDTQGPDQKDLLLVVGEDSGFRATPSEANRLKEIDSLLIVEEGSTLSVSSRDTHTTSLTAQSDIVSRIRGNYDQGKLGEGVLSGLKERQAEKEKILLIDEMLSQLTSDDPEELPEIPRSVLDELLAQCKEETERQTSSPVCK